ncbi:class I SAM-dependent methyltransferase [Streptomyces litchfieldiae]|uniref:Methyltransferase domain-containing protein n=1 Tax=Streptomyces litchfieldiae TaxID=3075543 RepID=A0ABU2N025_9ACTN|nr:methyltransferase domain-containing protein [Streptomyces sp. DSM 44938]MDT0346433.1 methyltransferase domain-containing protein [Streptomyces sp. DSM 44938]
MQWYEEEEFWSDFSSIMFSARRGAEIVRLVDEALLLEFARNARVLDLCCGPGLFLVPLARRGYRVTGVDLSPAMLKRAERAAAGAGVDARLVTTDMLTFAEPRSFDVVLNVFTFGYFEDPEDNARVLRNAYASLVPGGRLLIDVLGKEVLAGWIGRPQLVELDNDDGNDGAEGGYVIQRDTILDGWRRLRTDWTLVRGDTAREASLTCWLYSGAELCTMLEAVGFTDVECYGDFDGAPYDQHAKRLIVRGTRPNAPTQEEW